MRAVLTLSHRKTPPFLIDVAVVVNGIVLVHRDEIHTAFIAKRMCGSFRIPSLIVYINPRNTTTKLLLVTDHGDNSHYMT